MFANASTLQVADMNWDTKEATSMEKMFMGAEKFYGPLTLDTGNVVDFRSMFEGCVVFSGDNVSSFDLSSAIVNSTANLSRMFYNAGLYQNDGTSNTETDAVKKKSFIDLLESAGVKGDDMNSIVQVLTVTESTLVTTEVTLATVEIANVTNLMNATRPVVPCAIMRLMELNASLRRIVRNCMLQHRREGEFYRRRRILCAQSLWSS